jgi:peptidoglycan hydrolase CwlO-like protein
LDQEELKELKRLVADELQDLDHVVQSHEDGINALSAEKAEDRNIMRAIQKRLESLHKRVAKLEQQPPTGK